MSKSIAITSDNFETEVLQSPVPVLIDFWAPWCGYCTTISDTIEEIAAEYAGRLKVGKVNHDEEPALAKQHKILSLPTLVVYKDGAVVPQKSASGSKQAIEGMFTNLL